MHGGTEMKRLLVAFFMILIANTVYADNYVIFKSDVVERAINQLVASENRQAAADEYQKNMDQTSGKISVLGLYKVCIAAGFNIQTNDGYSLCRNFLNFMIQETEDMGIGIASQKTCANQFNGIWTISSDGTGYECVGRDGYELVYNKSCRGQDGECIKVFTNLQTQGSNGRKFINAYGKLHGLSLTCHANPDISTFGQDYIMCSAGGKSYEFEFDSLNQTPGDKSSNSENTAICELYGGKIVNTGDKYTEDIWQSCDISIELCNGSIKDLAFQTGHDVLYQGNCRLSREIKTVSVIGLNQIEGIDSRVFYNAGVQIRMDTAKPMVEEYLRTKFPNASYIVCGSEIKKLNAGMGIDIDYVMSCTVGSRQVDFIFDDLNESFDSDAMTGMEAMQCIINGGTFKGESCRGPTKEECENLDSVLRAKGDDKGARYDEKARACILGNAESTYKRDVAVGYITGAVVIVGGVIVTIGTGGATAPVVINGVALLAGDIAINYIMDANHQRLTNKAAKRFVDFVTDADACTTEQCAVDVLEKHYATLSGVMSDLNTDDQAVVDATMDRLIGLIQTDFVACGKDDTGKTVYASPADCAIQSSHLTMLDYIDPYSEIALVIGSVIFDPGYVVARFSKLNKVAKATDKITDIVDGVKDTTRATNKVEDAVAMKTVLSKGNEEEDLIAGVLNVESADVVKTAKQIDIQQSLNIIDPSTLKGDDIELYSLWKKYAPRNQSFEDFKKMGSLEEIRDMSKNWTSWDDIEKYSALSEKSKDITENMAAFLENPDVQNDFYRLPISDFESKYPWYAEQNRQLQEIFAQLDQYDYRTQVFPGNYSTYDQNLKQVKKDYDEKMSLLNATKQNLYNQNLGQEAIQEVESYINANKKLVNDYTVAKLVETVPLENAEDVAKLRAEQIQDIVESSPRLSEMRNNFSMLTDEQKIEFAQEISNDLLRRNGVDGISVLFPKVSNKMMEPTFNGSFNSYGYKVRNVGGSDFIVPISGYTNIDLSKSSSFSDFVNVLAHENAGHAVDYFNPNAGTLGAQASFAEYGVQGSTYDLYRKELSEQSAWRIGDVVEASIKSENPYKLKESLVLDVVIHGNGRLIDNVTEKVITYATTEEKLAVMSSFFEKLKNGDTYLELPYSVNISDNIEEISNMLKDNGLAIIFNRYNQTYNIGTPDVIY